ncbi:MAG TPA: alpha/beta hydrolase [Caulobacteraceae bacterium]|nr:alpha/beta hydrolase [Caulobacteraceae bacterium]
MTEQTDAPVAEPRRAGRPRLREAGAVEVGPFTLPYSGLASKAAREVFIGQLNPAPAGIAGDIAALRAHYDIQNARLADHMREVFSVDVREGEIGGVRVHVVTPASPRAANAGRVLVCLHGGAFTWGADSGALVEAIPIADRMGIEVVAVDYRMGPEHRFPAASEDAAAVYRALLDRHAPGAIGLYGCSAGAILAAQAVAWIARTGLPRPGAITMLGGGGEDLEGDSAYLGPALEGAESLGGPVRLSDFAYFAGAPAEDACVLPGRHPPVLARFPPTLLIAGGRDFAASSVTSLHLKLDAAGIETRLYLFDGLWHAFHIFPDLPESRHVYRIMSAFFDRFLDRAQG